MAPEAENMAALEAQNKENKRKRLEQELEEANENFPERTIDRYSY